MTKSFEVSVTPKVLEWARERAGYDLDSAIAGFSPEKIAAWESGKKKPTYVQLRKLAKKYHRSALFFTLPEPPDEPEMPDFRASRKTSSKDERKKNPALRAFIFMVEARCEWAAEYRREQGEEPLAAGLLRSVKIGEDPESAGQKIRRALGAQTADLIETRDHGKALRYWIDRIEAIGVFVFENDAAGGKGLPTELFRGLTVADDDYAPAIGLNAQDSRRGKIFTLAHELAHLAIGRPGLSNSDPVRTDMGKPKDKEIEDFCDNIAAAVVLPRADFLSEWERELAESGGDKKAAIGEIAERLHISRSVAAVKAQQCGKIGDDLSKQIRDEDYRNWKKRLEKKTGLDVFVCAESHENARARRQRLAPGHQTARAGSHGNARAKRVGRLFSLTILSACRDGDVNPTVARKLLGAMHFPQMDAVEEYWLHQGRAA